MKGYISLVNCDSSERLVKALSMKHMVTSIDAVDEINGSDLIIIDIDKSDSVLIDEIISREDIMVILKSNKKISCLEISKRNNVVDVIEGDVDVDFCLKKIKNHLRLLKWSYNNLDEKIKKISRTQAVLLSSIVELVECRDEATGGHIKRTAKYVELLVNALREEGIYSDYLDEECSIELIIGAPLHDVGKIGINDSTLRKTTKLDAGEFELMKKHVTLGVEAIDKIIDEVGNVGFFTKAREMAATHHENWDGTGYPNGLKGEEIPICGRIMALADVYDAITSVRSYKQGLSHEEAVKIMSASMRSKFDPKILEVFLKHNEKFKKYNEKKM